MKSILGLLSFVLFFITACGNRQAEIDAKKIYYFYQPNCSHCHHAKEYIDNKHPDLNMVEVDITVNKANFNLFLTCARNFNLENRLGTPLFCMGDKFIMGWSDSKQKQFDRYIQLFSKK